MTYGVRSVNHSEVQRHAQTEIDRVVGQQHLPDLKDRSSLLYVDAVLRETMRWRPVAPLGVPHATIEDDVYQGYYVYPKRWAASCGLRLIDFAGAMILVNLWAISWDVKKISKSRAVQARAFPGPDSVLNKDNIPWVFGSGCRIYSGRHVTDASLWSKMECILALFRIEKTKGSENVEWVKGVTT